MDLTSIPRQRRITNHVMRGLCGLAAATGGGTLLALLFPVLANGFGYFRLEFLTTMPTPMGIPGGGIVHAVVGSVIMVGLATVCGVPIGIGAGIYLAEYASPRIGTLVRFVADVLSGVPTIVIGVFGWTLIVLRTGSFSGLAGAFALGVISLPIVARTSEETLRLVPGEFREAALALGIPRWRTIVGVVLPTASAGLVTGVMLALARIAGETAPLIFTALGNNFWNTNPAKPMAAMTLTIFQYAIWPYDYLHQQAWAASFFLVLFVLLTSVVARLAAAQTVGKYQR